MSSEKSNQALNFAQLLTNLKWFAVTFVAVMTLILAVPASQLQFDQTIESFFAPQSPLLLTYLKNKRTFGGDEFLVVGFPVLEPTSSETLDKIAALSLELSQIPGIRPESMQDLASLLRNERAPGWMRVAMRLPAFQRTILEESRYMLVSEDEQTVAVAMRLLPVNDAVISRGETFRLVREVAVQHDARAVVAGEPLQVHDMFQYVEEDAQTLGIASSALLMLVILCLFRNLRWVILPILLIHVTLIWTQGILQLTNMKLSMVSSMLTSLVTIIGVATLMHVTLVFRESRLTLSRNEAYQRTFERLAAPIFWTCLSTAVGFAALLSSSIVPVRSFAVMMSLSTLLIPILCCLILPAGMLFGNIHSDPNTPFGEQQLVRALRAVARWSYRHSILVAVTALAIAGWAVCGLNRLHVETDFSKNFRPESPIIQALDFFESRMGGVGSWEISFAAPVELTEDFLEQVRRLSKELRDLRLSDGTQLTKVISLTDGLDLIPKVPLDTSGHGRVIPMLRRLRPATLDERREFLGMLQPEMEPSLYQGKEQRMRIMLRSLERQPAEVKLRLIADVERLSQQYFPDAQATGLYVLLANLISSLLGDQLISFLLAASGVTVMMTIAFRSFKVGVISMVPNIFPILVLIGGLSWMGIPLNIGTAMIASVSMGLTVDSSIHYLNSYLRYRRSGMDHLRATEEAHGHVGLALVLANLALVAGFTVLTLSNFVPLADFGILVSIAMLGGLASNILFMPVLLRWISVEPVAPTLT